MLGKILNLKVMETWYACVKKNKPFENHKEVKRKHLSMFLTDPCFLHPFQSASHSLTVAAENAFLAPERSLVRASMSILCLELDFTKCIFFTKN